MISVLAPVNGASPQEQPDMVPKNSKKSKPQKKAEREGPHHRAASQPNKQGYACPVCFVVPETIRNDGVSTARHLPGSTKAEKFRDTEFCNGQGQVGRFALDKHWKAGNEPVESITAKEHQAHGTKRYDERKARQEAAEQKRQDRANRPKKAKAEPKPRKAKVSVPKPKSRPKREAKAESSAESQEAAADAVTETPLAE